VERLVQAIQTWLDERSAASPAAKGPRQPSALHEATPPQRRKRKRKKRRRGPKRRSVRELRIDETVPLHPPDLPAGARCVGHKDFVVQDLKLEVRNRRYQRYRYVLPDGRHVTAPLPADVQGHYGPTLRSYVLYQHFQNHVTQPLIHEQLQDWGVIISEATINRLLSEGLETFHAEKAALLPAARSCSEYFQADDTPARHQGRNGHTLCLCNEFFTVFSTTETKSRLNFLNVIRAPFDDYVLGEEAWLYLEFFDFPQRRLAALQTAVGAGLVIDSTVAWEQQLTAWKITHADHRRLLTEAAVWGSLLKHELYDEQPWLSDDAQQFKLLGFPHALCWVHAERHVAELLPTPPRQVAAQDQVRTDIWEYYQRLKAYREQPTPVQAAALSRDFDRVFQRRTGWPVLNDVLRRLHGKKDELLRVLEYPAVPLHNNRNEGDIREYAKKRKISAGTRSDLGRRCRDTFLSLKKTCRKLGVSFWSYLQDRINGLKQILPLPELMQAAADAK
jgi:Transposase IS66 family